MNKALWAVPIAILCSAPAMSGEKIQLTDKEQTKLDKKLEGRTAGEPRSCISRFEQKNMTVISDDIIIFGPSRNAKTIFVNKPYGGCHGAKNNTIVTTRPSAQLCKGEIARVTDLPTGMDYGSCAFGKFVPYTKTAG